MKDAKVKLTGTVIISGSIALLVAGALSVPLSGPSNATPQFAQQTSKPCGQCHENAAGGGKLKPFGEKFKANGNKL